MTQPRPAPPTAVAVTMLPLATPDALPAAVHRELATQYAVGVLAELLELFPELVLEELLAVLAVRLAAAP